MKKIKLPFLILTLLLTASFHPPMRAQAQSPKRLSPTALVADLYKAHNQKRSPFFQTRSRARLDKYFEKSLADMLWKDAKTSKNEVGALDGDPLYDAQDMEIKKFAVNPATYEDGKAKVNVTFENFAQKKSFVYVLVNGRTGWRIQNIEYGEGRTLRGYLKGQG
jgi:hypothetical protein